VPRKFGDDRKTAFFFSGSSAGISRLEPD